MRKHWFNLENSEDLCLFGEFLEKKGEDPSCIGNFTFYDGVIWDSCRLEKDMRVHIDVKIIEGNLHYFLGIECSLNNLVI